VILGTPFEDVLMHHAFPVAGTLLLLASMALTAAPAQARPCCKKEKAHTEEILLAPWSGPYGGVPPFDQARVDVLKPALEAAMNATLAEVERIAVNPEAPTFENTIVAYERAGRTLGRVQAIWNVYSSNLSTPAFQELEQEMEPKMAAFQDRITQNAPLFRRMATVYDARENLGLNAEQQRLVWLQYTNFARTGARLDDASKKRLTEINQRLATLNTTFRQNVLADEEGGTLWLTDPADLAGLPDPVKDAAAQAGEEGGHKGQWAVMNTRSSVEPFLTYSTRRDLREKVWRTFVMRGDNGDAHDNNATITEILQLRLERAKLLGYSNHAAWQLELTMAKNPENTLKLMEAVWGPAVQRVHEEVADMQAIADKEGGNFKIEPWDYRFYAEKVRKEKYEVDENMVKPYLQLEQLREGMFWVAGELFGFQFTQVPESEVPVFHPDVRVWKVTSRTGDLVGLWFFDPYARQGKESGAWMTQYRSQERFDGEVPTIVSNNANFVKGKPGDPILVSWDDAATLFHEFGHALHGLSSNVTYPSVSGTAVPSDYVEFPSQILEHWLSTPEVLNKFARHYQTGEPMPQALVEKIRRSSTFNQGFYTVEYLASALVDMKLHLAATPTTDPRAFEKDTLQALGMPHEIVMRHRTPQFNHIFSSDEYSAGYYSYLWADTLTADAWEAFLQAPGGAYDKDLAKRLYDDVFSIGNTVDPLTAYRTFRGRDAGIDALMRVRGFPVPVTK